MFLAYRQTVDMFPVYSKSVDLFLTPFFANKHGGDDYQFHFLKPRRMRYAFTANEQHPGENDHA